MRGLYKCDCGNELLFMGCVLRKGLDPQMVEAGCSNCYRMYFIVIHDKEEHLEFRVNHRMNQLDMLKVDRRQMNGRLE